MTCKVEGKDGFTRYAQNPGYLPIMDDIVITDSLQEVFSER